MLKWMPYHLLPKFSFWLQLSPSVSLLDVPSVSLWQTPQMLSTVAHVFWFCFTHGCWNTQEAKNRMPLDSFTEDVHSRSLQWPHWSSEPKAAIATCHALDCVKVLKCLPHSDWHTCNPPSSQRLGQRNDINRKSVTAWFKDAWRCLKRRQNSCSSFLHSSLCVFALKGSGRQQDRALSLLQASTYYEDTRQECV